MVQLTPQEIINIYSLRLALSIAGVCDVKARLKHLRKMQASGVLSLFQHTQLEIAEAVAIVRGLQ